MKNTILLFCFACLLASCDYDVAEELYPIDLCDTTNISYSLDIVPIIDANCYRCHDAQTNQGNVAIDDYENFRAYSVNGIMLNVLNHEDNWPPMPEDAPKLDQCSIDKVERWILNGAKNN